MPTMPDRKEIDRSITDLVSGYIRFLNSDMLVSTHMHISSIVENYYAHGFEDIRSFISRCYRQMYQTLLDEQIALTHLWLSSYNIDSYSFRRTT